MKKKLFTYLGLAIISLFVGYSQVRADSNVFNITNFYYAYPYYADLPSGIESDIQLLISTYQQSGYASTYPYYIIFKSSSYVEGTTLRLTMSSCSNWQVYWDSNGHNFIMIPDSCAAQVSFNVNYVNHNVISTPSDTWYQSTSLPLLTSTDFTFTGYFNNDHTIDKVVIPSYYNNDLDVSYPSYELYEGDILPTYQSLTSGDYDTYEEIDLSDYAYVVLSLTDYEQDAFWTNIYTQGRLCLTPVYNYGMTQRNEIMQGTQVQSCTTSYEAMTPVNVSVLQSDIDNHAVYYVADYDNEGTVIKVDTEVFDITYVTQENADNPQVTIAGRSYPVIPYSSLTDSATISTDNNYVSGQVCSLGDVNCASEITGIDISDLWTSPLQLFKTVGNSITSVLGVITAFITFLPPTLQAFLYTAFFLVIILGIIKVLL